MELNSRTQYTKTNNAHDVNNLIQTNCRSGELQVEPPKLEELKPYYVVTELSVQHQLLFFVTLSYNKLMTYFHSNEQPTLSTWNPYDEVLDGVYLGRILEKEINPIPNDVGLIISVCTFGELAAIKFPLNEFINNGGKHIFIHMVDFGSQVSPNSVIETIKTMVDFRKNQRSTDKQKIYVHCKAGASRSASVVAAYDAYVNNVSLEESIRKLKQSRVQVDVGTEKRATFKGILRLTNTSEDNEFVESIKSKSPPGLASLEAKNRIRHLPSFKKLALYAHTFPTTKRASYIQDFFVTIYSANDAEWYSKLNSDGCSLKKFANATPVIDAYFGFEDKPYRENLVKAFISEVESVAKDFRHEEAIAGPLMRGTTDSVTSLTDTTSELTNSQAANLRADNF